MHSRHSMFRTRHGTGLHVAMDGPTDAPVTLVLAHGWTLDSRSWAPVASALTERGRPPVRVLRYDHRAHGRSDQVPRSEMTIEGLADDLAELLTALVPSGPVVLGGHSMGGMTIMALAERHPGLFAERVAGVALVSTASGGLADTTLGLPIRLLGLLRKGEEALAKAAWVDRRAAFSRRPALIAPAVRALVLGPHADPGALRISARCIAQCRPAALVGFRPTLDAHDRDAALAAFERVPTEVMVGTRDRLTPVGQARRIAATAAWARLTMYPGAGHMLPLERVDGVAERLSELLVRAGAKGRLSRAPSGSAQDHARQGGTSAR
ncbi:MAG TPA: alpha/beta fold hydrolase [Pseudonocardia sp.]|uniref:alpha/beta fold hydrolase n=1 Tax=Pseudonocardia sp. TaxID=60912 RepID=UPI002F41FED9